MTPIRFSEHQPSMNSATPQSIPKLALSRVIGKTYAECLRANRPIIITGLYDILPDMRSWTLPNVAQWIHEKPLAVTVVPRDTVSISGNARRDWISTAEYFSMMQAGFPDPSNLHYLAMQSVERVLPELKPHVRFEKLLPRGSVASTNFWMGPSGTRVCLHMDPYDNFFLQLLGQKTFYLYAPTDRKFLYPNSPFRPSPEESRVNPTNIDHQKFPLARRARQFKVTLNPGEVLFLPIYWWHAVVGSGDVTMSLNLWCKGRTFSSWDGFRQLTPRRIIDQLQGAYMNVFGIPKRYRPPVAPKPPPAR